MSEYNKNIKMQLLSWVSRYLCEFLVCVRFLKTKSKANNKSKCNSNLKIRYIQNKILLKGQNTIKKWF